MEILLYSRSFEERFLTTLAANCSITGGRLIDGRAADEIEEKRAQTQDVKPSETIHFSFVLSECLGLLFLKDEKDRLDNSTILVFKALRLY